MGKLIEKLTAKDTLVADGAWGTLLQAKGLEAGGCPEKWNIDRPNDVLEVASSYINAGSDMIETNTFGGNRFKLMHYGLESQVFEINKKAAEISRKAAGQDRIVLGSVGPTGKMLMMGDVTEEELYDAFKEQSLGLEAGGADGIIIETMSDIDEAKLAIKAAKENTSCDIVCSMTFNQSPDGKFHTMMGITPQQMVKDLIDTGVDIIGSNCGNGMKQMIGIIQEIRSVDTNIPIFIQANAGAPIYKDGNTVFPESPIEMGQFVETIIENGANIIGGCCGTTPEHINVIAERVKKVSAQ